MSRFVITFNPDATRLDYNPTIDCETCSAKEARGRFRELCNTEGPRGGGIFLFDLNRSQSPTLSYRF